ncbi:TraV family lipoprotein [Thiomicrospira sp.]|uniref:TraV family lipoprotein n=1 Tax=Thiomicrospira sp. TaxID=935 RepID=UPI002F92939F
MKNKHILAALGFALVASGCSSNGKFSCPYGESCAPIDKVYESSINDTSTESWSVWGNEYDLITQDNWACSKSGNQCDKSKTKPTEKTVSLALPFADSLPGAVYHPPKPHKVWLAPWQDKSGVLHSGSYAWFTTPSYWTYAGVRMDQEGMTSQSDREFDVEPAYFDGLNVAPPNEGLVEGLEGVAQNLNQTFGR